MGCDWRDSAFKRAQIAAIVGVGHPLIRLLGSSYRWRVSGAEHLDAIDASGQHPILAFWHGRILTATWFFRRRGIVVITSENFDGEWIAGIIERFFHDLRCAFCVFDAGGQYLTKRRTTGEACDELRRDALLLEFLHGLVEKTLRRHHAAAQRPSALSNDGQRNYRRQQQRPYGPSSSFNQCKHALLRFRLI